jgi:hypothetical protein
MVSDVRRGKSPRSLAAKLTGVTAHDLPPRKSAAKKPAANCQEEKAVQMGRDDEEGVQELVHLQRHPDHHTSWQLTLHCHIDASP